MRLSVLGNGTTTGFLTRHIHNPAFWISFSYVITPKNTFKNSMLE